jgi:hypothetical protein
MSQLYTGAQINFGDPYLTYGCTPDNPVTLECGTTRRFLREPRGLYFGGKGYSPPPPPETDILPRKNTAISCSISNDKIV